jgi:hypothetical protein
MGWAGPGRAARLKAGVKPSEGGGFGINKGGLDGINWIETIVFICLD